MKRRAAASLARKIRIKLRNRDFKYKDKSASAWAKSALRYHKKYGTKKTLGRLKTEVSKAAKHPGADSQLVFPNGIKTGFDHDHMGKWYRKNNRHTAIVIPSYNDYELLVSCLESIAQTTNPARANVIIVDDYCTKESREYLTSLQTDNVEIVLRKRNGGFAKAVNTGLKHVRKNYPKSDVLLLNSDTTAHPGWLIALQYGAYKYHDDVGIVGAKLLYPDGRIQSGGSHRNTEHPEWFDHYYRFQPANYGPACVPQYCIGVTGACMYITNKAFNKLGLLDEKFQFAFEDMDYCIRGWERGIRSLYFPEAVLTHHESVSRSKHTTLKPREQASINYFWQKWGDWFDKRNVKNAEGKTRIIYVLQSTGVSGGHKIAFQHLNILKDLGYDAELWALDKHPTWTELRVPTRTFKNYEQLTKALENEEAIKVATWWETAMPVWLASLRKGIPAFVIHEVETAFYPNNPLVQSTVTTSYRKEFNNIISCGYTLEGMQALGLTGSLIPCGYDNDIYHPLKNNRRDTRTMLAVGRSFFQKNFKQTYAAWQSLDINKPKLVLFGTEPDLVKKQEGVTYRVRPSDKEVNKLYNQATVFVQTSYHEGFCLPVLEAMSAGCPVICTDAHGNRDFCFDDKNCIMVEKDDVKGLATTIDRVLSDDKLRQRLTIAGLKTARDYTWPVVGQKLDRYYRSLAAQPNKQYIEDRIKRGLK